MKFKRALVFILCVVLALPLVACNDVERGGPDSGTDKCTVTFDIGEAAKAANVFLYPETISVDKGKAVGTLPEPVGYTGYTFNGWFMPDGKQMISSTVITSDVTVTAKWKSKAELMEEAREYENSLSSWCQAGHLYIHYKRYDHMATEEGVVINSGAPTYNSALQSEVYKDWGLWIWPKNNEGRLFNAMKVDKSGAVYDILIDHTYNDAGWDADLKEHKDLEINYADVASVGTQLFQISTRRLAGFWSNDGGNNYLKLENIKRDDGTYHWYVNQGHVGSGTAYYENAIYDNPYADDDGLSKISHSNINSLKNNKSDYPLAPIATGYEDAGVGYQIFIASFADSDGDGMGDLQGIIDHLDYIESLNVDVLWLTPFQSSTNYHGYDIDDYFSVDTRFGTLADYRQLVYEVHKRGMKIVMDYVLNHTSQANPWFVNSKNLVVEKDADGNEIDYRNFYNWINKEQYEQLNQYEKTQWYKDEYDYYYYSSFSSDMPELNYDYQPVRDAVLEVCNYWMSFGLDGFRLDAVKHIYMNNEKVGDATGGKIIVEDGKTIDITKVVEERDEDGKIISSNYDYYAYNQTRDLNFWREFNYRLKAAHPNAFLVSENFDGNPANTAPFYAGMDSQFNFNLYYDVTRGLAASVCQANDWLGGIATAYGNYTKYKNVNKNFIDSPFTSNHDLMRARDRLNIKSTNGLNDKFNAFYDDGTMDGSAGGDVNTTAVNTTDILMRMYYAFNMTIPGVSWIYYGDEIGMTGAMQTMLNGKLAADAKDHEDRIYRQPMKWYDNVEDNSSYSIGFETYKSELIGLNATDYVHGVDWQEDNEGSLLKWMQLLTHIRREYGLASGSVSISSSNGGKIEYTVNGTKGKLKVYMYAGSDLPSGSGLAKFSGTIGNKTYGVMIEEA